MSQPRYCTACGALCTQLEPYIFECSNGHRNYSNPVPGSAVFIVKGREVLYGQRAIEPHKGGCNIAGGFMHPDETAEACAVRESKEEFGIDIKIIDYLGSYTSNYDERKIINFVFVAKYSSGDVRAGDDMVPGSQEWRALDNLPSKEDLAWKWVAEPQELLKQWFEKRLI